MTSHGTHPDRLVNSSASIFGCVHLKYKVNNKTIIRFTFGAGLGFGLTMTGCRRGFVFLRALRRSNADGIFTL